MRVVLTDLFNILVSGVDSRIAEEDPQLSRGTWKGRSVGGLKMKLHFRIGLLFFAPTDLIHFFTSNDLFLCPEVV